MVIADDEHLIVKNLTQIIDWQRLDYEIVGTAQNGKEALKIKLTIIKLLKKINSMVHPNCYLNKRL